MERGKFVVEGHMRIGPYREYFFFLDGAFLADLVLRHYGLPEERGYTHVGRVRVTIERLDEGAHKFGVESSGGRGSQR
jgi:hypothetical protein